MPFFRSGDLSPPGLGPVLEPTAFRGRPWAPSKAEDVFSEGPAVHTQPCSREKQGATCLPSRSQPCAGSHARSPGLRVTVQRELQAPMDRAYALFPGTGELPGRGAGGHQGDQVWTPALQVSTLQQHLFPGPLTEPRDTCG